MMKLVFLVAVCVLGTVLCETHVQQQEYAESLINEMEYVAKAIVEYLMSSDESTEEKAYILLIQAKSLHSDIRFISKCLKHVAYENQRDSVELQEIVLKLKYVTYELEDSFTYEISDVKLQLSYSINSVLNEAKELQNIIRSNRNHKYRSTTLRFLDDLMNAIKKLYLSSVIRAGPVKIVLQSAVQLSRTSLTFYLSLINSEDQEVHNEIAQYSSKFSSVISATATLLQNLTSNAITEDEVKEIVYSLKKISYANEEVLYNEDSFKKIKDQLQVTIVGVAKQLNKMIDVGFSETFVQDDNLIYIVFPEMLSHTYWLMRIFEKTYNNYIQ